MVAELIGGSMGGQAVGSGWLGAREYGESMETLGTVPACATDPVAPILPTGLRAGKLGTGPLE